MSLRQIGFGDNQVNPAPEMEGSAWLPLWLSISVWDESFWLPHNVSRAQLEDSQNPVYPRLKDLYFLLPWTWAIYVLRLLFERFIATPFAKFLGVDCKPIQKAQQNIVLEKVFKDITTEPGKNHLTRLAKQLDWDTKKVIQWFKLRRYQDRPSLLTKFCESMWKFSFYLWAFSFSFYYLSKSPWLWDSRECWYNYPFHELSFEVYIHFMMEFAFYGSLIFSQFFDVKRKDFVVMCVHHHVTILLLTIAYVANMTRTGSIILLLHDAADIVLELAKMANYAKWQNICNIFFLMFAVVFIVTRLVIYPIMSIRSVFFESWEIIGPYKTWGFINLLLITLQIMHIYWSYLIIRMVFKAFHKGKVSKDDRSDVDSSSEDEDQAEQNAHAKTS
uniref:ceramide synthase 6-like isoform X2 n=1 Tax=Pristiophorus japonicus TaxID=55135 RepID=UPI00398EDB80